MKAAFGLAGILVTLGVIVWLMSAKGGALDQANTALQAKKSSEEKMAPLAGRNADGGKISDTMTLEPFTPPGGTKVRGLLVSRLEPSNALAIHFGLRQYDLITKVNGIPVSDDPGTAEALVQESVGRNYPLTVTRGSQELTLPQSPGSAQPGSPGAPPSGSPLQRQLEGIQKIPTH